MDLWLHLMECSYPEGCTCGTSAYNALAEKVAEQQSLMREAAKALSDWNNGQGVDEDLELIKKLRS
jgi:hypothetical protein